MHPAKKFRLILLPYLTIAVGFIVLYTFLNWLLVVKTGALSIKDDVVEYWLPAALPWIPVLLWLRPRLNLLRLSNGGGKDYSMLYYIVVWVGISGSTILAQHYLSAATGTLTPLATINHIDAKPPAKYYTVSGYYIDKSNIGLHTAVNTSGKYEEDLNIYLYIALPMRATEQDSLPVACKAWFGKMYRKQISNRLDSAEKETEYQKFLAECQANFDTVDLARFVYLAKVGNSDDGDGFRAAIKQHRTFAGSTAPVFIGVNEPFEGRTGSTLPWFFGLFGVTTLVFALALLLPGFDEEKLERLEGGRAETASGAVQDALDFLKPKEGFFMAPILIYLNVLIYLAMVFAGLGFIDFRADDLLAWGANFGPATRGGQWWRLLTCTFLHGGLMHLLSNMYGLFFVSVFLEPLLGRWRFLAVYLGTGILASCASLWWYPATVSVGASGAIFGLYGIFLALMLTKVFPADFGKAFISSTLIFVGYNLLMGFTGNIDNAAHIGGLLSGLLAGLALTPKLKAEIREREPEMPFKELAE